MEGINYLQAKASECVSQGNYSAAIDFYLQLHETLNKLRPADKGELLSTTEKIVKLLNAVAMKFIQEGLLRIYF